jgi:uncharacterized protein
MTDVDRTTSQDTRLWEEPAFIAASGETLFGMLSTPTGEDVSVGVIVLGGGGTTPTATGRNRFYVRLCRRLAALGFPALRFDYHGLGDSTGIAEFRLDRPFVQDLEGAVRWLSDRGIDRYLLVGMCFGARTALAAGPYLDGVAGLALLAPPVRDYALSESRTSGWRLQDFLLAIIRPRRLLGAGEKLTVRRYLRFLRSGMRIALRRIRGTARSERDAFSWVSQRFLRPLSTLSERRVPVLLLYGTSDEEYGDFERARASGLGEEIARWPTVEVQILDGQVHGFTRVASQDPTMDAVVGWLSRIAPVRP